MKKITLAASALTAAATAASAGGLDRSYTSIDALFERGNYAEVSLGFSMPDVTGSDLLGNQIANVADDFSLFGAAVKMDFGENLSFGLIFDQPYGADVLYGGNPAATMLGGTMADAQSQALTALLRYKFNENFSVYAGPRILQAEGEITLSGLAYGPANGYNVKFASDTGVGFVGGVAYERPDIAMRAALTYHSAIDLGFSTTETFPGGAPIATGDTNSEVPQSIELSLQSGVAANTLAFGSIRWSEWSAFTLMPPGLGANLAELDDTITYEIGIGRRFSEKFSAQIAISYEAGGSDSLVSPLAPTNGQTAVSNGGKYKINDMVDLSGGIRYTWLGDGLPETGTPDTQRGTFTNNNALSVGMKLGFHF